MGIPPVEPARQFAVLREARDAAVVAGSAAAAVRAVALIHREFEGNGPRQKAAALEDLRRDLPAADGPGADAARRTLAEWAAVAVAVADDAVTAGQYALAADLLRAADAAAGRAGRTDLIGRAATRLADV